MYSIEYGGLLESGLVSEAKGWEMLDEQVQIMQKKSNERSHTTLFI